MGDPRGKIIEQSNQGFRAKNRGKNPIDEKVEGEGEMGDNF